MKHSDATLFIVYALWVKGHTERTIGAFLGLGHKQVAGIVARSPFTNRAALSPQERQEQLNKLKAMHNDGGQLRCGGKLAKFTWVIEPLERAQAAKRRRR